MPALRNLERSYPDYVELSLFLLNLSVVAIFLVNFYNIELLTPYNQTLKVTTSSNLKLCFYTNEPEEFMGILKKEKE